MIIEAVLITLCCVLFISMGLSGAVQERTRRIGFLSCPKCLTFWVCLVYFLASGYPLLDSVTASFISSYSALWLSLVYDLLATLYNKIYETITETDTSEVDEANPDEVS